MRIFACSIVLVAACGTPPADGIDDGPDAAVMVSASCQEATMHSDLAWIQANVFDKSCVFSGCHKSPAPNAGNLVLEDGMSRAALVGQPAQTESGWMRVVAGDESKSYLLAAIGATDGPVPSGGLMPLSSPELCSEKRDAIARWVAAGAQP